MKTTYTFIKFSGILFISAHVNKQTLNCPVSRYRQKSKILALFSFVMTAEFGVWTRKEVSMRNDRKVLAELPKHEGCVWW